MKFSRKAAQKSLRRLGKTGASKKVSRALTKKLLGKIEGGRKKMGPGKAIQKSLRRLGKAGAAKKVSRALTKKLLGKIDDL